MKTKKGICSLAIAALVCGTIYAKEDIGLHKANNAHRALATGCAQDEGAAFLAINNVRARIMDEGDMWWNPGTNLQQYFEPASGKACPEFAGALWIGGLDAGGQLKVAAMTYRQNGEDFWTGPLDTVTVSITPSECAFYDKLYPVNRLEVQNFVANPGNPAYLTADIKGWPGNGQASNKEAHYLAPFVDVGGTGTYDPSLGDYPGYDLKGTNHNCQNELFGDATLWWVINDEGNVHTESGGIAIGLEIRCQAFAFQTNDAINNMTFYNYQIINRSSYQINQTYFGAWNDFDLGNGGLNYTGCDVSRSMGYGYESQNSNPDGTGNFAGETGYHNDLPAIGEVFFQGPVADAHDTNCYVHGGKIGMARFVYYNNDFSVMGNPTNVTHYYNYLRGLWTDGTPMTYGGNGYQSSSTPCSYMFPWTPQPVTGTAVNTDPTGCGTGRVIQTAEWDENEAKDPGGDRRFIESAGPFTLLPGAINYVTTGLVWDQTAVLNNQFLSIGLIQQDADLAQALFNNCFKVLNGPDAPDLTIQELKNELIITISNAPTSNNYKEHYAERSPTIVAPYTDTMYVFEGYEIFQVLDSSVTATELLDPSKARLVAECDINNGVSQLVNYTFNSALGSNVATLEVTKNNKGIVHSFDIKSDQFQEDNQPTLVNDRPYYYIAIAYGYNNYCTYNPLGPDSLLKNGQKLPFLQGRRNTKVYNAIPHIPSAQSYGTIQNSQYGEQPVITRIEGHGNGNNTIELDQNSIDYIMQNDTMAHPTYLADQGPINVKVVDPLSVPAGNFIIKMVKGAASAGMDSSARWKVYQPGCGPNDTIYSDTNINFQDEQVIPQWGLSIEINDVDLPMPAYGQLNNNDVLDSSCTMTFADPTKNWLSGLQSGAAGINPLWWIRCGTYTDPGAAKGGTPDAGYNCAGIPNDAHPADPNCDFSQIIGGTWAPYFMCAGSSGKLSCDNGPKFTLNDFSSLAYLSSVDIVITTDRSKWTRCPVLEEQDQTALAQGGAAKLSPRNSPSVDQDGNYAAVGAASQTTDPSLATYISATGMGWFPGYAINVETGERLNMAFGEDSWLVQDSGRNMKWDPDSTIIRPNNSSFFGFESVFGGKHYIYVFGHNSDGTPKHVVPAYDGGLVMMQQFATNNNVNKGHIFADAMWVNIPLLKSGHQLFECDVNIKLRVATPYGTDWGGLLANNPATPWGNTSPDNNNYPMYEFSTNGMQVINNNDSAAKAALNLINIVPNPYYGYSSYESDRLDTRVRITNLPPTCTISIFTLNGALVNVINKQNPNTYIDWNLQNQFNVPIASGLYVLYINVPGVGSKTLKWFGVMRPLDLNSY